MSDDAKALAAAAVFAARLGFRVFDQRPIPSGEALNRENLRAARLLARSNVRRTLALMRGGV
jgi:hypothetical protein